VYIIVWDSPAGLHASGPFEDREAGLGWWHGMSSLMDPAQHRAVGCMLFEPVDMGADPASSVLPGPLHHQNTDADDRANGGFVVLIVVSETVSFGAGLFPTRDSAERWFRVQKGQLAGAPGLVLPLLSPVA
jgi:hypothetical protein